MGDWVLLGMLKGKVDGEGSSKEGEERWKGRGWMARENEEEEEEWDEGGRREKKQVK